MGSYERAVNNVEGSWVVAVNGLPVATLPKTIEIEHGNLLDHRFSTLAALGSKEIGAVLQTVKVNSRAWSFQIRKSPTPWGLTKLPSP